MPTAATAVPVIRHADEARLLNVAGVATRVLLDGSHTGGAFSLFELVCPPGQGVPPHIHSREDEAFHLLEGSLEIEVDGRPHALAPGASVFGPRGVPHAFRNAGTRDARFLVIATPAGFERFFTECHERLPASAPLDVALFMKIIADHGMTVVQR